jgi:hypothetical protein
MRLLPARERRIRPIGPVVCRVRIAPRPASLGDDGHGVPVPPISSVTTAKLSSLAGPKVLLIATSAASRPRGMDVDEPALARVIKPEWQGMWKARPFHEFKWSGELAMTTTSSASIYRTIGG